LCSVPVDRQVLPIALNFACFAVLNQFICQRKTIMQPNPVVWFEIYVQDMQRAKAFYEAVLNTTLEKMPAPTAEMTMEMWTFPSDQTTAQTSYGANGMLVKMEGFQPGGGGTLVYFGCQDCAAAAARAASNGGTVVKEKTSIGQHGFFALACDTEGNMIGFHSM
jgi:predicted enzyme related to lactoylglutathione lyase